MIRDGDETLQSLYKTARALLGGLSILGGEAYADEILADKDFRIVFYRSHEAVITRKHFDKTLCLVLQGTLDVIKGSGNKKPVIRSLAEGELFGIASLFGHCEEYVSEIVAKTDSAVAFIPQQIVTSVFRKNPEAALSYIALLSDKIRYLNARLDDFTAPSAYAKLCHCLLEKGDCTLSMQSLAASLGISRMTLYRNLDLLVENGCIRKEGKSITVVDREKLLLGASSDSIL